MFRQTAFYVILFASFQGKEAKLMLTRVSQYIKKHTLLPPGSRVLVGVSGGADSVALLHILHALQAELGIELAAAHFHHGIRAEADGDEQFVRELCRKLGVPLYFGRADVPALARESGMSMEVAAREARHAFFRETMASEGFNRLALAHHQGDQAETVLLRLVRGAGTHGLGAMAPMEASGIVRPLLCVGREDILRYCRENSLSWREDRTNEDTTIPRNWVRHELLPLIRQTLNPSVEETLCRTAELLRRDEDYLDSEARRALESMKVRAGGGVSVNISAVAGLHPALRSRALRLLIAKAGLVTDVELSNIEEVEALLAEGMSGKRIDLGRGFTALREGETISVTPKLPSQGQYPAVPLSVPGRTRTPLGEFVCEMLDHVPADLNRHVNTVQYFDRDAFPGNAAARSRLPGDRFHALGAPGSRKLKEYLIDRKTGRWSRDTIPVLACGSDVLWVVGHDIADGVKITDATKRLLKITFINGEDDSNHA